MAVLWCHLDTFQCNLYLFTFSQVSNLLLLTQLWADYLSYLVGKPVTQCCQAVGRLLWWMWVPQLSLELVAINNGVTASIPRGQWQPKGAWCGDVSPFPPFLPPPTSCWQKGCRLGFRDRERFFHNNYLTKWLYTLCTLTENSLHWRVKNGYDGKPCPNDHLAFVVIDAFESFAMNTSSKNRLEFGPFKKSVHS